jgi:hypothetical protein
VKDRKHKGLTACRCNAPAVGRRVECGLGGSQSSIPSVGKASAGAGGVPGVPATPPMGKSEAAQPLIGVLRSRLVRPIGGPDTVRATLGEPRSRLFRPKGVPDTVRATLKDGEDGLGRRRLAASTRNLPPNADTNSHNAL